MHSYVPVTSDIYWIGMNDRYTQLFEGLWPLPRGVCYNSYIILDEKIALIDSVKEMGCEKYLDKIRSLLPEGRNDARRLVSKFVKFMLPYRISPEN